MSLWEDFLESIDEYFGDASRPGKVLICFVNRHGNGMDGVQYKFKYDGMEKAGTTTAQDYCIELQPKSFNPINTFVWSRQSLAFKKLDDVIAEPGQRKVVRKFLKTFKVDGHPKQLPRHPTNNPPPEKHAPPPPPGPSPKDNQGHNPKDGQDENGIPQAKPERPVPISITKEQLRKIFPKLKGGAPTDAHLQAVADELNTDLAKYKLDTPYRRAHFFGQVKRESPSLSGAAENLNYTPEGLIATFGYYRKHKKEAMEDGRIEQKLPKGKKKITQAAKQETIANKVYMGPDGNDSLGNDQPGDGWKFRGRGVHQTTGRKNYGAFTKASPKYWDGENDFLANPELLAQMPYTLRSAVAFWLDHGCWQDADAGITDAATDAVTKKINSGEVKKHNAHEYSDPKNDPVLLRRQYVKLAYAAFT
jgi:predicted chitinase